MNSKPLVEIRIKVVSTNVIDAIHILEAVDNLENTKPNICIVPSTKCGKNKKRL